MHDQPPVHDAGWWRRVRGYIYFGILIAGMTAVVLAGWLTLHDIGP